MRGRVRTWTDEQLRDAVGKSTNLSDVIRALGLRPAGGNHLSVKKHLARLEVDTSHFNRESQLRGLRARHVANDLSSDQVFCERSRAYGKAVRRRARSTILPIICAHCGNTGEWQGRPLTLQLDHVNGKYDDNHLENLRWLCPNCHSQTETFAGRGSVRRVREVAPRYRVRYVGIGALAGASRPSH
jgi:5-methylcytosine-specific restriction endonuclease McrA